MFTLNMIVIIGGNGMKMGERYLERKKRESVYKHVCVSMYMCLSMQISLCVYVQ